MLYKIAIWQFLCENSYNNVFCFVWIAKRAFAVINNGISVPDRNQTRQIPLQNVKWRIGISAVLHLQQKNKIMSWNKQSKKLKT